MEMAKVQHNLEKTLNYFSSKRKDRQKSENNEILDKLESCLIKNRILNFSREQIQNKSGRMVGYTFRKPSKFKANTKK